MTDEVQPSQALAARADDPPTASVKSAPSFIGHLITGLLASLAGAAGAIALSPIFAAQPAADAAARAAQMEAIRSAQTQAETQIQGLEQDLAGVTARLALAEAAQGDRAALESLNERLSAMEIGIETLRSATARVESDSATKAEVAAIAAEFADIQRQVDAFPIGEAPDALSARVAGAAALALAKTEELAESGQPFETMLTPLGALLPGDRHVAALAPLARTGIATRADLVAQFAKLETAIANSTAVLVNSAAQPKNPIEAVFRPFVTVRRQTPEIEEARDLLVRARTRLEAGDLAGAVADLGRLRGDAGKTAAAWLTSARRRTDAEAQFAALRESLWRRAKLSED